MRRVVFGIAQSGLDCRDGVWVPLQRCFHKVDTLALALSFAARLKHSLHHNCVQKSREPSVDCACDRLLHSHRPTPADPVIVPMSMWVGHIIAS